MPLDWTGPHTGALDMMAAIDGWRWLVLEDRGLGPVMDYGPYSRTWIGYLDQGVVDDLVPLPLYNKVNVDYTTYNGTTAQEQAVATPDPLLSYGMQSQFSLTLPDPQPDGGTAGVLAASAVEYLSTYRVSGQVGIGAVVSAETGTMGNPYDVRPGDLLYLPDHDPALVPQRIVAMDYTRSGVTAHLSEKPLLSGQNTGRSVLRSAVDLSPGNGRKGSGSGNRARDFGTWREVQHDSRP
jgi:hypothetical protein